MRSGFLLFSLMVCETAFAQADSPPDWVREETGALEVDGKRLVFAVGRSELSNPTLARDQAGVAARRRLSRILLDAAAPKAAPKAHGADTMFGEMMREEVKHSLEEATLDGVEVNATWRSPSNERTYAIATAPWSALATGLKRVPLATGERRKAEAVLEGSLRKLQSQTQLPADALPRLGADSFGRKPNSGAPPWIHSACGRYQEQGREMLFGVGVGNAQNPAIAFQLANNRARTELSKCVSFHVDQRGGTLKVFSSNTLWGVEVAERYFAPDGTVYALAQVPTANLPSQEQEAVVEKRRVEKSEPSAPTPPAKTPCPSPRSGKGLRIALGVIGPESTDLEREVRNELELRKFRVLSPENKRARADGQLVLKVNANPQSETLRR
ncbi:MAG: hypothetical protein AAFQ82_10365, partial [Myxococcota bacterium]